MSSRTRHPFRARSIRLPTKPISRAHRSMKLVKEPFSSNRYFIKIEGFTDKAGSSAYNDELSRPRAEHVMGYLVMQHNIPVFRIQDIGLGKEKPADTGRNRAARAKNRRVEIH